MPRHRVSFNYRAASWNRPRRVVAKTDWQNGEKTLIPSATEWENFQGSDFHRNLRPNWIAIQALMGGPCGLPLRPPGDVCAKPRGPTIRPHVVFSMA